MENAIEVRDLTKRYGEILAVDHISFDVKEGEIFGFLGPNGAGKTTTIRMLTGLCGPTTGTARIFGLNVVSEIVEVKRNIGVVPEISNLYDELSAFDNLLFMAQLYERKDHLFSTFSRGMKRALTIAAGLIHSPRCFFSTNLQ